ncbi:MAG: hypothetical protein HY516_02125 [Candidatus Aenigmarchaeota archaeon]|nr:hypothetical protein [Candidatus Aenigmarchaeota archaeon]
MIHKKKHNDAPVGLVLVLFFAAAIIYLFASSDSAKGQIPSYVTGDVRAVYEWARTQEGNDLLEQMPCYCGCKYEGHKHARHCFWRDDGSFDRHGTTCSTCLDIAKKTMQMSKQGKSVCEIRNEIDRFYAPNVNLGTNTPMPRGCAAS